MCALFAYIGYVTLRVWETREHERISAHGGLPSLIGGATLRKKERRALPMITYSDMIQFCMFIVALVGLCYQIFKGKRK